MRTTVLRLALATCALVACKRETPAARPPAAPVTRDAGAPTVVFQTRDASTDTPRVAARDAASDARADTVARSREYDLLRVVPLALAVSSVVSNNSERPWHLIDGDPNTAWNSRTGDLVGAWIAVRVPEGAALNSFLLSAGFASVKRGQDLFTMNHRITRVRVSRDGKALGEFPLDPNVRTPQRIAVSGGPGEYKIEVLATLPGSRTDWQEICVSELEVRGTLPAGAPLSRAYSDMRVGAFSSTAVSEFSAALFRVNSARDSLEEATREIRHCDYKERVDADGHPTEDITGDGVIDHADEEELSATCYPQDYARLYRRARNDLADAMAGLAKAGCARSPAFLAALRVYEARAKEVDAFEGPMQWTEQEGFNDGDGDEKKQAPRDATATVAGGDAAPSEIDPDDVWSLRDAALKTLLEQCGQRVEGLDLLPAPVSTEPDLDE
jgi:hypothetical protein